MKTFVFLLLTGFVLYREIAAQSLVLMNEVKITQPVAVSADRYHNIYIGDTKGNIYKYDSTGTYNYTFSPQRNANISAIEAWPSQQIFVFYKDIQAFTVLNRFLTPVSASNKINPDKIGFARAATITSNESLWLFDDTDFSLKKYDLSSQTISLHTPLSLILGNAEYNINFIREYQNMVFVNDQNSGILVFDNLGNYKKKLPFAGLTYCGFQGTELYFLQNNQLHTFNLYTSTEKIISLPASQVFLYGLWLGNKVVLFTKDSFQIFQMTS